MTNTIRRFWLTAQEPDPKPAPEVDPETTETPEIEPPITPVTPIPNII